jgi:6-pyruvoyltetrahydropterin/6-carboxytetrahydropterin synthase
MYTVAVKRDFIAQHYLIGGDWGAENFLHSHHFVVEVQLQGATLDHHNYLVDIVDIEANLEAMVAQYRDKTLNEMPAFNPNNTPVNPSIEHFSRVFCQEMATRITAPNIQTITIKLWENEIAWASYKMEIGAT